MVEKRNSAGADSPEAGSEGFVPMMYLKRRHTLLVAGAALLLGLSRCQSPEVTPEDRSPAIAVIPKGTTHVFWKSVEAGARQAGQDLGVDVIWKGPLKENDRAQQIALVEQFVTEGVAGIVLAPLDDTALVRPVSIARSKEIPVVIIDSALKGEAGKDFISFVATNNRRGGEMAGDQLAELLGGQGKVLLLRYMVGSASTTNREEGFLEAIRDYPGIEIIVDNQYGGATAGETIQKSEELLDQLREADGIFCPNESSTYGMLVTLRKNLLTRSVKFVGFDASKDLLNALGEGDIDALVVQNPRKMGYEGVRAVVSHLRGESVPTRIDTGVELVTPDNINDPNIQSLVTPEG